MFCSLDKTFNTQQLVPAKGGPKENIKASTAQTNEQDDLA